MGAVLRFLTAGESHGPGIVAIVEGLPAGLAFASEELAAELARRRLGTGRSRRMEIEKDEFEILGGIRFGRTLGSPVAVVIRNVEWPRWEREMSPVPGTPVHPRTAPRPGHVDLAGMLKYDTHDARDVLERASARETAARAVAGFLAKALLAEIGIEVLSHVVAIGTVEAKLAKPLGPGDRDQIDASPVRCADLAAEALMLAEIEAAAETGDSVGGVVEVLAFGVPAGFGSHVHYDRKLDGLLAGAVMSIPAVKGVEIGDGFAGTRHLGSIAHDPISLQAGRMARSTNRAGGIEGGISNGEVVRVRAAVKPVATLMTPLPSVDVVSKQPADAFRERSDVCIVPAAGVVAEAMVAVVLAQEAQRVLGGDTVAAMQAAAAAHRRRLEAF